MEYYPFNSRNNLYRNKVGAIAEGETLRLRLLLHNDAHVHNAFLRLYPDDNHGCKELMMTPGESLDNYRFYDCEITLAKGLYWYKFRYTSDYGVFEVTKTKHGKGIVSSEGNCWQQTVYDKDFKTPDWLSGGIIYQIFPDRFKKSGIPKQNVPEDRYLCDDWTKQPEYRQNCGKCSLGNDYYGGDLKGIEEKLPYLNSLGVTCIYLNPIFEAHSNHRYNTADYFKIDPLLGTEDDLVSLIESAKQYNISIVLDGVFSHTGDDSKYFNRYNRYDSIGAYQSEDSPYHSWYKFHHFPNHYSAWWGIATLPETNEDDLAFSDFITGEDGVLRYWIKKGIRGWRLDVADELPDNFLDLVRLAIKTEDNDCYLLGEVWEDATNKISYGSRRRFLRGNQLDSVMNYPFANAIVNYIRGGNADDLSETVLDILENYPKESVKLLMNHIGTHDTARIITRLGSEDSYVGDREWQSKRILDKNEYENGVRLLKLAAVLQYTLPGIPSVFYGDEAGLTGYGDPFCRATYPWNNENTGLIEFYRTLGSLRQNNKAFAGGEYTPLISDLGTMAYIRSSDKNAVLIAINRWSEPVTIKIPKEFSNSQVFHGSNPNNNKLTVGSYDFGILIVNL